MERYTHILLNYSPERYYAEFLNEYTRSYSVHRLRVLYEYLDMALKMNRVDAAKQLIRHSNPEARRMINVYIRRTKTRQIMNDIRKNMRNTESVVESAESESDSSIYDTNEISDTGISSSEEFV